MIPRFGNNGFSLGKFRKGAKDKEEIEEEEVVQGGYVRRGSEYQQFSDWHHDVQLTLPP
jgi:hypothetical protein